MAFTGGDITDLQAAIATGALRVRFADGRETTYRSLAEMREILKMMQASVAAASPEASSRSFVAGF